MSKENWPRKVAVGNVTVRVYKMDHPSAKTGVIYVLSYHEGGFRKRQKFADKAQALAEAQLKAEQLNAGRVEGASMSTGDRDELQAARKLAGEVPVIAALQEWATVRRLTDGNPIAVAQAWQAHNAKPIKRVKIGDAIDDFIKAKEKAKKQGERTYRAKLSPLAVAFADQYLDAISATAFTDYLERYGDPVTRNDLRKRIVALCRWAQKQKYLPRGIIPEIELTERAEEDDSTKEMGVYTADTFGKLLEHFRLEHPEHLAALVLAGFCGIRSDELHGKRADPSKRQIWEHVRLADKVVQVTSAKKRTPSNRLVPLCDAASEWLMLCDDRKGPVCETLAMDKVRKLAREAGFELPENCFRHSFITYRVAETENVAATSLEAGNSPKIVHQHYRQLATKAEGVAWFNVRPANLGKIGRVISIKQGAA